jgi:RNA polymerase sigma-70 factor (ECF subfamily)
VTLLRVVPAPPEVAPAKCSDQEIVDAVISGDERVAGHLYDRVVGVVDRTLYRVFGRREPDHDDLVQATFERIVATLSTGKFAGACSLATWASSIASHVGLNALRARRRERRVVDRREPLEGPLSERQKARDEEGALGARMELERLRACLAAMDPERANAVFLHDVVGHDLAEIAVLTGASVAAAQSRLVRGRKELFERMRCGEVT